MSDPATLTERVQRRLRHHWQQRGNDGELSATTLELRARLLNTPERRARSCGNPYCPCADVDPACPRWEGDEQYPNRCPRCGAPRSYHDDQVGGGTAMSYVEQARQGLLNYLNDSQDDWADDERLLDLYTLLVLVKGPDVTLADVHDAWAIARQRTRPEHTDLIPFDRLTETVKAYDQPYADAIGRAGMVRYLGSPS